jgi:UDP-N-acetylmuramate dehydrogenase
MVSGMNQAPFSFAMENYPLAPNTLYNVGGPARLALLPENPQQVEAAYCWMIEQPEARLILGGGSNVLIADKGFPGIVLFTTRLKRLEPLGDNRYFVASGNDLAVLVKIMIENNYDGVGALTGIPGSVGGAIYMNAGTANGSTCQFLESVDLMTPQGLKTIPMDPSRYSYRGQSFCAPGDVILGGTFRFQVAEQDQRAIYTHYMNRRKEKQPWGHCCGSVFKNPPGDHAGRLIEACGLKGARHGGAIISPIHANFIMNDNNASFDDILTLITRAKDAVRKQFGVELEEEVRVIRT